MSRFTNAMDRKQREAATTSELTLLLSTIERLGKGWMSEMPPEAAREAAIRVRFDPNLWETLRLTHKDTAVEICESLAHIKLLLERVLNTIEQEGKPPNLRLARFRTTVDREEADRRGG